MGLGGAILNCFEKILSCIIQYSASVMASEIVEELLLISIFYKLPKSFEFRFLSDPLVCTSTMTNQPKYWEASLSYIF